MTLDLPPFRILDIPPDPTMKSLSSTAVYMRIIQTQRTKMRFGWWKYEAKAGSDESSLYVTIRIRRRLSGWLIPIVDEYTALKSVSDSMGMDLIIAIENRQPFTFGFLSDLKRGA